METNRTVATGKSESFRENGAEKALPLTIDITQGIESARVTTNYNLLQNNA